MITQNSYNYSELFSDDVSVNSYNFPFWRSRAGYPYDFPRHNLDRACCEKAQDSIQLIRTMQYQGKRAIATSNGLDYLLRTTVKQMTRIARSEPGLPDLEKKHRLCSALSKQICMTNLQHDSVCNFSIS
jgi:hypothetical protein